MDRATKRKIRRFLYQARAPAAYVVLLVGGLFLFLSALHSCYQSNDGGQRGSDGIVTEER